MWACRHDFSCFSCGRQFQLPGTSFIKANSKTKINNETLQQRTKVSIENNAQSSKEAPKRSLIPPRNPQSKITKENVEPNSSKNINDPPIEIESVGHEYYDDANMIDDPNSGEEIILADSNINNNEYNLPAAKIENIDRSVYRLYGKTYTV